MMRALLVWLLLAAAPLCAQTYDTAGRLKTTAEVTNTSATASPVASRLTDGSGFIVPVLDTTLTARFPAGSTPADNESNAVTITRNGAFAFVFDGATWDRWTGAVSQSGTWNLGTLTSITNPVAVTGTFWQATQPISIEQTGNNNAVDVLTMPAITGSVTANAGTDLNTSALLTTTAHDAAFGAAGTADAQVRTIQGIASMTPVQVSQATASSLNATVTDGSGAMTVDGTVTANAGTGTFATDPTDEDARVLGRAKIHDGTDTALVSGSGSLQVTCDNCGGSTFADDDAFVGGTTAVVPFAALYDTSPPTITDGSAGTPRMSNTRVLLVDGSGATQPVSGTFWQATQPVSGTFWQTTQPISIEQTGNNNAVDVLTIAAGDTNIGNVDIVTMPAVAISQTTTNNDVDVTTLPNVTVGTFPDNEPFNLAQVAGASVQVANGTAAGAIRVTVASDSTGQIAVASLPNEGQQTAANSISVTPDTDNDATGATGAAPPGEVVDVGGRTSGADTTGLMTGLTICTDHVAVDIVTATTTLIVTGVANRHVRICSINLVTAAANNVALIAGTGATCGTSTAGINGGVTAAEGWNFAANGGLTLGSGIGEVMSTKVSGGATGDSVCIITSAATQLSGTIAYAIY